MEWVRHIINEVNASGFDSLRPKPVAGGTQRTFDDEIRLGIANMALTPPAEAWLPLWKCRFDYLSKPISEFSEIFQR